MQRGDDGFPQAVSRIPSDAAGDPRLCWRRGSLQATSSQSPDVGQSPVRQPGTKEVPAEVQLIDGADVKQPDPKRLRSDGAGEDRRTAERFDTS